MLVLYKCSPVLEFCDIIADYRQEFPLIRRQSKSCESATFSLGTECLWTFALMPSSALQEVLGTMMLGQVVDGQSPVCYLHDFS